MSCIWPAIRPNHYPVEHYKSLIILQDNAGINADVLLANEGESVLLDDVKLCGEGYMNNRSTEENCGLSRELIGGGLASDTLIGGGLASDTLIGGGLANNILIGGCLASDSLIGGGLASNMLIGGGFASDVSLNLNALGADSGNTRAPQDYFTGKASIKYYNERKNIILL